MQHGLKRKIRSRSLITIKAPVNNRDLTCGVCSHFHRPIKELYRGKRLCAKFRRVAASEHYKIIRCKHTKLNFMPYCRLYGKKIYPFICAINFEKKKRFCFFRCEVYK